MSCDKIKIGCIYRITSMHHPVFAEQTGKEVVALKVLGNSVFCSENKPVTYRINRLGRHVVDHDPRSCQTLYSAEQLEPVIGAIRAF